MTMLADNLPYGARASMEPAGLTLVYRNCDGFQRVLETDSFAACEDEAAQLTPAFDGEALQVELVVRKPLTAESLQVELRHAFAGDEAVLLNGYQSWTDTAEVGVWSRMRGLRGVPKMLVDHYTLDGAGDYAIVDYPAKRGWLHGFTYATFRRGEAMVLVGSLDESRGFTQVHTRAARGKVALQAECPARVLQTGERVVLGRYAIVRGDEAGCYDRWFELLGVKARPVKPLVGYTSWYRHYDDIDEAKLLADLTGAREAFAAGDGELRVWEGPVAAGEKALAVPQLLFQIDDGFCKVGDWLEVDSAKFPQGLAPLAKRIREAGFLPGLWVAPFVCSAGSRLCREHPEWLLRDEAGDPVSTGCHWGGAFALDTLNTDVRTYVLEVLQAMTREWGFGLLKADFLYAACMIPHGGMNRGELMADAMELLRAGAGEQALVLGCGVPLASAFGRVDYCRIGCDVGLDWDDKPPMRLLQRERVSTKRSLGNTYGRAPLDGRAFGNDPDVFFLRPDARLTQGQRDELLFADADLGSVLLTSDDMGQWTPEMRGRYREALRVLLGK